MATCSDWSEEEDHATFVRISELEKLLKEERERLSAKCTNPNKPRKTASKPPKLEPLPEQKTLERAHEYLECPNPPSHLSPQSPLLLPPPLPPPSRQHNTLENLRLDTAQRHQQSHLSTDVAKKREKDSRSLDERSKRKEAKKVAARAELEKLRLENQRIEDQEAEANEILAKLSLEVYNEERKKVKPKERVLNQQLPPPKPKPIEDSTEALLLKKEIEKQEQEGQAIALQRKNIMQILHQIRKAQNVQICIVGDIRQASTRHLLQLSYLNLESLEHHLKPRHPKIQINAAFVMQTGFVHKQVFSFGQKMFSLPLPANNSDYSSIDLRMLIQAACQLEWDAGSTKILVLLLKNQYIYSLPSDLLETLREGFQVTCFDILCEAHVDQAKVHSWRSQAGGNSWAFVRKISDDNVVQVLAHSIMVSTGKQEFLLFHKKGNATPNNAEIPTEVHGKLNHLQQKLEAQSFKETVKEVDCIEKNASISLDSRPITISIRWSVYKGFLFEGQKHVLIRNSNAVKCGNRALVDLIDSMNVARLLSQKFTKNEFCLEFMPWSFFSSPSHHFIIHDFIDPADLKHKAERFQSDTLFSRTETYSHWTHHVSKGYLLVECLEVLKTLNGVCVADVSVHSKDLMRFSSLNMGTPGMDQFFSRHECNDHCRRLNLPRHPKQVTLNPLNVIKPPQQKSTLSTIGDSIKSVLGFGPTISDATKEKACATRPAHLNRCVNAELPGKYPGNCSVNERLRSTNLEQMQSIGKASSEAPSPNKPDAHSNGLFPKDYAAAVKTSVNNQPKEKEFGAIGLSEKDLGSRVSRRDQAEQAQTPRQRSGSLETKKSNLACGVRTRSASPMIRKKEGAAGKSESKEQPPRVREPLIPIKANELKLKKTSKK